MEVTEFQLSYVSVWFRVEGSGLLVIQVSIRVWRVRLPGFISQLHSLVAVNLGHLI